MSEVNKIFYKNVITVVVKTKRDIRNSWFKNTKTLKAIVLFKASSAFDIWCMETVVSAIGVEPINVEEFA